MRIFDLPLTEPYEEGKPHLVCYLQEPMAEEPPMPAVVVYPGGGYAVCSEREAEPIALEYAKQGYQTFILYYTVNEARDENIKIYPQPLIDGARALNIIRQHAEEWYVDPHAIAVLGFSAGGHCAALLSCLWNDPVIAEAGLSNELARPDACMLGYPVITSQPGHCHDGSFRMLLGPDCDAQRAGMALETRVTEQNPPTFLWHTASDNAVPVTSSYRFADALSAKGVPVEMHIFPFGPHGLGLADERTSAGRPELEVPVAARWMTYSCDWLRRLFGR